MPGGGAEGLGGVCVGMSWAVVCRGCVFVRARYEALGGFGTARESEIAYAHQVNVVGVGL